MRTIADSGVIGSSSNLFHSLAKKTSPFTPGLTIDTLGGIQYEKPIKLILERYCIKLLNLLSFVLMN